MIGGRAEGTAEAVQDRLNGLLVDGGDATAIAAALNELLSDAALYAQLQSGALAIASTSDWASRVASFRELCTRVAPHR